MGVAGTKTSLRSPLELGLKQTRVVRTGTEKRRRARGGLGKIGLSGFRESELFGERAIKVHARNQDPDATWATLLPEQLHGLVGAFWDPNRKESRDPS